jgi:hypothetical protein
VPDGGAPVEALRGDQCLPREKNPGGEDAIEQGLDQRGAEETCAPLGLERDAQGFFQRDADIGQRGQCSRVFDTVKRVACVRGDEPCDVLRLAQGDGLGERPLEIFPERAANMFSRLPWHRGHVPERFRVSGEAEAFEFCRAAVRRTIFILRFPALRKKTGIGKNSGKTLQREA